MNSKKDTLPTIAILDDYYNRAADFADWHNANFASFEFFEETIASQEELIDRLQPFNAVGLMRERTPFPSDVIRHLPNLELIVTSGKKNASIDVSAAKDQGITVCGTESPGHATAELAFLLIMSLSRQLVPLTNALKQQGEWQPLMGRDLRGQTLGILGLGRLGSQLASFAKTMSMRVIAWSENLTEQHCAEHSVEYVNRENLFQQADIVSIHLRHSNRTHKLVDSTDLQRLGEHGYIVNTSRAEIIDLEALKHALDNNIIAGAATDVFPVEFAGQDSWLVSHPKVLATPHIGYCTEETFAVFYSQMLDAMQAWFAGSPIRVISSAG